MKKVVLAALLVCAAIASGLPSALAQQAVSLGTGAAAAACPPMQDSEYKPYNDAITQTDQKAKVAAIEAYLTAFPQSCYKLPTLVILMQTYAGINDMATTLTTADRVLQLDPSNLRALTFETYLRKQSADALTDPAAKQSGLDAAAGFAQKGLTATKPADTDDATFKALQSAAYPIFYSAIGYAALNKKDGPTAIDAYKKELAFVPIAATEAPGPQLQDTLELASAYLQSTPPDLLNCAFFAARFVDYAPEPYKTQYTPTAKYCYRKFHGGDDGYDAVAAAAQASLFPADGFQATVKPAPTPSDIINGVFASTPDLSTLAVDDKEFILQNGTPDQAAKVWDTVKGKSSQFPDVLVIASTPTQIQVAISADAIQNKTADFTFNMAPPDDTKTAAEAAAAKKRADAVVAATAVGNKVTLTGAYDSFTPNPIMITMTGGDVVLPEAAKPKATVHHPVAHKKAQ